MKRLTPTEDGRAPLICGVCHAVIRTDPDVDSEDGRRTQVCKCDPDEIRGHCFLTKEEFMNRASEVLG